MTDRDEDGIADAVESAIELESGNINPSSKWDYFKSAPRSLIKYMCLALLPVPFIKDGIDPDIVKSFYYLVFGLFLARGGEKMVDMWTARKT